jgi:hypothetical protein
MAAAAWLLGCNSILGIGDPSLGSGGSGASTTSQGGAAGQGGSVEGGAGGLGGSGGEGGTAASCEGCSGDITWSRGYGTSGRTVGTALAVGNGRVVAAGHSNGTVDFGSGPTSASGDGFSIVVAALDPTGQLLWDRRFGGSGDERVRGMDLLPNGDVVIAGTFDGDLTLGALTASALDEDGFVALLDGSDGSATWLATFGGLDDQGVEDVAVTSDGHIALVGYFADGLESSLPPIDAVGGADMFVASLAAGGTLTWVEVFASISDEHGRAIVADAGGGLRVAGEFIGALTVGATSLLNDAQGESFVARLDGAGSASWAVQLGGNNSQFIHDLALDSAGRLAIGGGLESELLVDAGTPITALFSDQQWLAVVDDAGQLVFRELYAQLQGPDVDDDAVSVAFDPVDGNLVLAGWFAGTGSWGGAMFTSAPNGSMVASDDLFAAKIGPDGTHFWSRIAGDGADQQGRDLVVAADRSILQVGAYRGDLTLQSTHACAATECMFVVSASP